MYFGESLDEDTISLNFIFIPFFFLPVLALIFFIPGQMSQKNGEKKDGAVFEDYQSCCWACSSLCDVWSVAVQ